MTEPRITDPDDHGPGCDGPLNCTCEPIERGTLVEFDSYGGGILAGMLAEPKLSHGTITGYAHYRGALTGYHVDTVDGAHVVTAPSNVHAVLGRQFAGWANLTLDELRAGARPAVRS